jgi:hypothetical protein
MTDDTVSRREFLLKSTTIGLVAGGGFCGSAFGQSIYNPNITELTQFVRGSLPILIVAPHGGTELVQGIASRRNVNRPVSNFSYYGSIWTREICVQISNVIKRLSGETPYMVLNLAHRRYVDVNREESDAYESNLNAPRIYWEYHDFINEYVNRMNVLYENPILIEISGQSDLPDLIVRRTLNGRTVKRLTEAVGQKLYLNSKYGEEFYQRQLKYYTDLSKKYTNAGQQQKIKAAIKTLEEKKEKKILKYGRYAYTGKNSLIGEIQKRGYRINPSLYEADMEQALTIAGNYTLERYATREINNINAIQLVIGSDYRRTSNYLQTGRDLGNAIWTFAERYIIDSNISEI